MTFLKTQLRRTLADIPPGSRVWYLDYPVHANIGDLLIMLGTEQFFRTHDIYVQQRYTYHDFPFGTLVPDDTLIVMHGGGNFGDLYPAHQVFRERIIADYPNHRIIILPQTVHFESRSAAAALTKAMSLHRHLSIYVRDRRSLQFVREHLPGARSELCPDMAHQLWPSLFEWRGLRRNSTLYLLRSDKEKITTASSIPADTIAMDWRDLLSKFDRRVIPLFVSALRRNISRVLPVSVLWGHYAQFLVRKAIQWYFRFDNIVTSRLHGHILACLMGKPSVLLDNSYGKNSAYFFTWTHRLPMVKCISSGDVDLTVTSGSPL